MNFFFVYTTSETSWRFLWFFLTSSSKPLVCLFPPLFKQNLLSFIHLVHSVLPRTAVLHLIKCLSQDSRPNPWVTALCRQLERDLETHREVPLYTTPCSQRLKELSQGLIGSAETGGWTKCFSGQTAEFESQSTSDLSELGTQRKRKGSFVSVGSDGEETGSQSKRIKMDDNECVTAEELRVPKEMSGAPESDVAAETPASDSSCGGLPEQIKVKTTIQRRVPSPHWNLSANFNVCFVLREAEVVKRWADLLFLCLLGLYSSDKRVVGESDGGKKILFSSSSFSADSKWHLVSLSFFLCVSVGPELHRCVQSAEQLWLKPSMSSII